MMQGETTFTMGLNQFTDMKDNEKQGMFGARPPPPPYQQ